MTRLYRRRTARCHSLLEPARASARWWPAPRPRSRHPPTAGRAAASSVPGDSAGPARSPPRRPGRRRRRRCWLAPRRAPSSARRVGHRAPRATARLSSSDPEPIPLPGRPAGVALVEPERDPTPDRLVQGQVGELVAERAGEVAAVGAEQDGPASGQGDAGAPRGARPRVSESSRRASGTTMRRSGPGWRRPRPGQSVGSAGLARQIHGQRQLGGPGDRGHLAHLNRCRWSGGRCPQRRAEKT